MSCPITKEDLESRVGRLQEIVNELDTGGYSNVADWVGVLDKKVCANVQIMCSSKKLIVFLF